MDARGEHGNGDNPGTSRGTNLPRVDRKSPNYSPDSVETWVTTEIEQESFAFLWNLTNYSALCGLDEVKSPVFRGGPKSNRTWELKLVPKKKSDDEEHFSVHLILRGFGDRGTSQHPNIKVRFQISLVGADGRPEKQQGSCTANVCEFENPCIWGYDKFIMSTDIVVPARLLLEDDALKIHCRLWFEGNLKHTVCNVGIDKRNLSKEGEKTKRRKDLLCSDFGKMFKESIITDIAICTGESVFRAHKAVLAARSSVFAAMFRANEMETQVDISDFDEEVVKGMLEYIYTGETKVVAEKAPELLEAAEKYDLNGLKEDCEDTIVENLHCR